MTRKKRCRICRAEEGKQHKMDCTFDRYQRYEGARPSLYIYDETSSSSSSSPDTGSSSGGCE
jgi:hypothetical protein